MVPMANLTIKNLPDKLYRELQTQAKRNQRSLNNQIIVTIQRALGADHVDPAELRAQARLFRQRTKAGLSPEEIELAIHHGRP